MTLSGGWRMLLDRIAPYARIDPLEDFVMDDAQRRMQFIFTLRSAGVTDKPVLQALESTDRQAFLEGVFKARAFDDTALPISCGQTISQPSIVGMMTQALELDRRCKVLEIGTGSGYQAAILSKLARRVYTIERHPHLARAARKLLGDMGLANVTVITGDGTQGLPEQAPFDRIIVTAAAEDTPGSLLAQLKVGGVMVLPVGQSDHVQRLIKVTKKEHGADYQELALVRFVPLLEGLAEDHPPKG
jgi:protein-L-isoaspartate(D-aspartate) O-methyltransferase